MAIVYHKIQTSYAIPDDTIYAWIGERYIACMQNIANTKTAILDTTSAVKHIYAISEYLHNLQ